LTEAGYKFEVIPPNEDVECGVCSESGPAGLVAELAYRKAAAVRQQLLAKPQFAIRDPNSTVILAADTVAECDGFILGKPRDEIDAREMLKQLSGREHRVLTGVCLWPLLPLPPGEGRGEGTVKPPLPERLLSFARKLRKNRTDVDEVLQDTEAVLEALWNALNEQQDALTPNPSPKGRGGPIIRVDVTKLWMDALTDQQLNEYVSSGGWEGKAGAFGYQDRLGWVHITAGSESNVVGLPMELLAEMMAELGQGAGGTGQADGHVRQ
jgi:predicted house-cleaning NTP pyrophosphatase (Maf/HAM1 superfamily)